MTTVVLQVYDYYNAYATAVADVLIEKNQNVSVFSLTKDLSKVTSELGGSASAVMNVIAVVGTVLNRVNCSLAPNCTRFNRQDCSDLAHTCGSCLTGFTGIDGSSNTICSRSSSRRRLILSNTNDDPVIDTIRASISSNDPCTVNKDCSNSMEICLSGRCLWKDDNKPCPDPTCSSYQGQCLYRNIHTHQLVSNCSLSNEYCEAFCSCSTGFYGVSCELSSIDYQQNVHLKSTLLSLLYNSSLLMNFLNSQDMINFLSQIISLTKKSDEINAFQSLLLVNAFTPKIYEESIDKTSSIDSIVKNYFTVFDSLLSSMASTPSSSLTVLSYQQIIHQFLQFMSSDLLIGEFPFQQTTSQMRLTTSVLSATDSSIYRNSYSLPLTSTEKLAGSGPSSITLPKMISLNDTSSYVLMGFQLKTWLFTSSPSYFHSRKSLPLLSNPMIWWLEGSDQGQYRLNCQDANDCSVEIILQYNQFLHTIDPYEEIIETQCYDRDYSVYNYSCRTHPEPLTVKCPGTHGKFYNRCPIVNMTSICQRFVTQREGAADSFYFFNFSSCRTQSYTPTNVTCQCSIREDLYQIQTQQQATVAAAVSPRNHRAISSSAVVSSSSLSSISFGYSVAQYPYTYDFREYFDELVAKEPTTLTLFVTGSLSSLVGLVLLFFLFSNYQDAAHRKEKIKNWNKEHSSSKQEEDRQPPRPTSLMTPTTVSSQKMKNKSKEKEKSATPENLLSIASLIHKEAVTNHGGPTSSLLKKITDVDEELLEATIPRFYQTTSTNLDEKNHHENQLDGSAWNRMIFWKLCQEIYSYHRYLNLFTHGNTLYPSSLRLLAIANQIFLFFFWNSFLFQIFLINSLRKDYCSSFLNEKACQFALPFQRKHPWTIPDHEIWSKSEYTCHWNYVDHLCFVDETVSIRNIFIVLVISMILTMIISRFIEFNLFLKIPISWNQWNINHLDQRIDEEDAFQFFFKWDFFVWCHQYYDRFLQRDSSLFFFSFWKSKAPEERDMQSFGVASTKDEKSITGRGKELLKKLRLNQDIHPTDKHQGNSDGNERRQPRPLARIRRKKSPRPNSLLKQSLRPAASPRRFNSSSGGNNKNIHHLQVQTTHPNNLYDGSSMREPSTPELLSSKKNSFNYSFDSNSGDEAAFMMSSTSRDYQEAMMMQQQRHQQQREGANNNNDDNHSPSYRDKFLNSKFYYSLALQSKPFYMYFPRNNNFFDDSSLELFSSKANRYKARNFISSQIQHEYDVIQNRIQYYCESQLFLGNEDISRSLLKKWGMTSSYDFGRTTYSYHDLPWYQYENRANILIPELLFYCREMSIRELELLAFSNFDNHVNVFLQQQLNPELYYQDEHYHSPLVFARNDDHLQVQSPLSSSRSTPSDARGDRTDHTAVGEEEEVYDKAKDPYALPIPPHLLNDYSYQLKVALLLKQNMNAMRTKRLLYLFQRDFLGSILGNQILDNKTIRDAFHFHWDHYYHYIHLFYGSIYSFRTILSFVLGYAVLVALMIWYILSFSFAASKELQQAWFTSLWIYLLLEVVVLSTLEVIVIHVLLPSTIFNDLYRIRGIILQKVNSLATEEAVKEELTQRQLEQQRKQQQSVAGKNYEDYVRPFHQEDPSPPDQHFHFQPKHDESAYDMNKVRSLLPNNKQQQQHRGSITEHSFPVSPTFMRLSSFQQPFSPSHLPAAAVGKLERQGPIDPIQVQELEHEENNNQDGFEFDQIYSVPSNDSELHTPINQLHGKMNAESFFQYNQKQNYSKQINNNLTDKDRLYGKQLFQNSSNSFDSMDISPPAQMKPSLSSLNPNLPIPPPIDIPVRPPSFLFASQNELHDNIARTTRLHSGDVRGDVDTFLLVDGPSRAKRQQAKPPTIMNSSPSSSIKSTKSPRSPMFKLKPKSVQGNHENGSRKMTKPQANKKASIKSFSPRMLTRGQSMTNSPKREGAIVPYDLNEGDYMERGKKQIYPTSHSQRTLKVPQNIPVSQQTLLNNFLLIDSQSFDSSEEFYPEIRYSTKQPLTPEEPEDVRQLPLKTRQLLLNTHSHGLYDKKTINSIEFFFVSFRVAQYFMGTVEYDLISSFEDTLPPGSALPESLLLRSHLKRLSFTGKTNDPAERAEQYQLPTSFKNQSSVPIVEGNLPSPPSTPALLNGLQPDSPVKQNDLIGEIEEQFENDNFFFFQSFYSSTKKSQKEKNNSANRSFFGSSFFGLLSPTTGNGRSPQVADILQTITEDPSPVKEKSGPPVITPANDAEVVTLFSYEGIVVLLATILTNFYLQPIYVQDICVQFAITGLIFGLLFIFYFSFHTVANDPYYILIPSLLIPFLIWILWYFPFVSRFFGSLLQWIWNYFFPMETKDEDISIHDEDIIGGPDGESDEVEDERVLHDVIASSNAFSDDPMTAWQRWKKSVTEFFYGPTPRPSSAAIIHLGDFAQSFKANNDELLERRKARSDGNPLSTSSSCDDVVHQNTTLDDLEENERQADLLRTPSDSLRKTISRGSKNSSASSTAGNRIKDDLNHTITSQARDKPTPRSFQSSSTRSSISQDQNFPHSDRSISSTIHSNRIFGSKFIKPQRIFHDPENTQDLSPREASSQEVEDSVKPFEEASQMRQTPNNPRDLCIEDVYDNHQQTDNQLFDINENNDRFYEENPQSEHRSRSRSHSLVKQENETKKVEEDKLLMNKAQQVRPSPSFYQAKYPLDYTPPRVRYPRTPSPANATAHQSNLSKQDRTIESILPLHESNSTPQREHPLYQRNRIYFKQNNPLQSHNRSPTHELSHYASTILLTPSPITKQDGAEYHSFIGDLDVDDDLRSPPISLLNEPLSGQKENHTAYDDSSDGEDDINSEIGAPQIYPQSPMVPSSLARQLTNSRQHSGIKKQHLLPQHSVIYPSLDKDDDDDNDASSLLTAETSFKLLHDDSRSWKANESRSSDNEEDFVPDPISHSIRSFELPTQLDQSDNLNSTNEPSYQKNRLEFTESNK